VGQLTALAFVLIMGKAERFQCGKQISREENIGSHCPPLVFALDSR
jgi:hypothetical protein